MASLLETSSFGYQNFYETALTSDITDSALDVFLDSVPSVSEGTLIIDPESDTNREVIYYSSKTSTKVVCPANGRGYDNSTATSHTAGTTVIMAPIADWFYSLRNLFTTTPQGWTSVGATPSVVTNNGNRSYSLTFSATDLTATLSAGMRLKFTRTVTAPTQCADLESGSSQYFNKTSPAGTTFTDDFVCGAWIKLESYAFQTIISRYNGTSGWSLELTAAGQVQLIGYNASSANHSYVQSYQSVPLGKWVHISAQLDMSAFTATTTTSYVMIDGVDVPALVARAGTNPTALVQAGDLQVGRQNATGYFDGKLAQVFYSSAKITQANVRTLMSQGLTASLISTHSIVSAYSLSNAITDLNTGTANNLTAQGSAVATATDSPFAGGSVGTTEYGIISSTPVFSTDTTMTVQVPEGYAIPTSGGVSAVSYSTHAVPYGFPAMTNILGQARIMATQTTTSGSTVALNGLSVPVTVPAGRTVRITLDPGGLTHSANQFITLNIWEGTVGSGTKIMTRNVQGSNAIFTSALIQVEYTPTTSSTSFNVGWLTGAATATVTAATDQPGFLRVELIGGF